MVYALTLLVSLVLAQSPLSDKRASLQPEVLITTLSAEELAKHPATHAPEHDTEVARHEAVTIVVRIGDCTKDAKGTCNASADVVAYKPDGSVHTEVKNVGLNTGRGSTALTLSEKDVTGLYKVVATVRDLNGRRFGKAERSFGVK
jgi:hypothetical protein